MAQAKEATKPRTDVPNKNGAAASPDQFPSSVTRTLQGVTIELPTKFKPGHQLTYAEALFASNAHMAAVRSAFEDTAKQMRDPDRTVINEDGSKGKKLGPATQEEVQKAFLEYATEYEWSPRGEATPADPVEAQMRVIARNELNLHDKNASSPFKWPEGKEKREFALSAYIKKYEARLRKQAEANLNATPALGEDFLAEIGAS